MTDLLEVVEMARDYNPELDVRVLLTRIDPRTKDTAEMLAFLHERKLNVLPTRICERVAFRRSDWRRCRGARELGRDQTAIPRSREHFLTRYSDEYA